MAEDCCLCPYDYVNVRVCNLHNLHHTGHIENHKQHTADLQLVALFPSHLVLVQFLGSQTQAGWWCGLSESCRQSVQGGVTENYA